MTSEACLKNRGFQARRYHGTFSSSVTAVSSDQLVDISRLASATLAASGLSYSRIQDLFSRGAPILKALHLLCDDGLGSAETIKRKVSETADVCSALRLKPILRAHIEGGLPIGDLIFPVSQ